MFVDGLRDPWEAKMVMLNMHAVCEISNTDCDDVHEEVFQKKHEICEST